MLVGPSGCGKTVCVQSVSKSMPERPFFTFNLGATQDPRGYLIGNTHFSNINGTYVVQSHFVHAIQQPNSIVLLDELSRGHYDAWNILMSVLDEKQKYLRIDEDPATPVIKVADGVCFVATANIGSEYTGTRVLDRGLSDRFPNMIEMAPLSFDDEWKLLKQEYPEHKSNIILEQIARIANITRREVQSETGRIANMISTRMTKEMAGLVADGFTLADIAESCIYPFYSSQGGVDSPRTFMKQVVQQYLKVD